MNPFYCISYYDGDVSWIELLPKDQYVVYAKKPLDNSNISNVQSRPNVGYNIDSYLTFIIDHYENLPELVIFCKNNLVSRHVSEGAFKKACASRIFTPIEDPSYWHGMRFPISVISNDGGYLELNNSWYISKYPARYFASYNEFYAFIFGAITHPTYLRFAPGANYVVPRDNILSRSKIFYLNLRKFVSHAKDSCESHFIERSLVAIWSSSIKESNEMRVELTEENLNALVFNCQIIQSQRKVLVRKIKNLVFNKVGAFFFRFFGPA